MTSIRNNVLANLAGRIWAALMSFAFVPFYIRFLGMESYGFIGFFAAMMGVFAVLDLGLGLTVNRELARLTASKDANAKVGDLMRTFECIYWLVALSIGTTLFLIAPLVVDHWLNIGTIPHDRAVLAVRIMGLTALMRWPVSLYVGAMMGMQQQIRLNVTTSIAATLSGAGAVLVLTSSPTLGAFFSWQAIVAGVQVMVLRYLVWQSLDLGGHRPQVTLASIRGSLQFSAGITGITLLSVILTQLDKFMLSWLLPLRVFGYYALAGAIAAVLITAGSAVESAAFPALARLIAAGDAEGERRLYHQASQGLAVLIVPLTAVLVLFSPQLLVAYVHDPAIARATSPLLSVLAAGNGVLALMFMPLSLQLANGWTRLSLIKNIIAVIAFVPLLYVLVLRFGAIGAAWTWLSLTLGYLLIEVPVMHRRLLPGAQWRWYAQDIGIPVVVSVLLLGSLRAALPVSWTILVQVILIAVAALFAVVLSAVALPSIRNVLLARFGREARA